MWQMIELIEFIAVDRLESNILSMIDESDSFGIISKKIIIPGNTILILKNRTVDLLHIILIIIRFATTDMVNAIR